MLFLCNEETLKMLNCDYIESDKVQLNKKDIYKKIININLTNRLSLKLKIYNITNCVLYFDSIFINLFLAFHLRYPF